jgi:hypothetical protein
MSTSNDLVPRTGTFPMPGSEGDHAPRKIKVHSQAVVLVIILGVSAAALSSMRHIGIKAGMNFKGSDTTLQPAAMPDDPAKVARYDRIMKDLQQLQQPLDIALGELAKIPALIPSDRKIDRPLAAGPVADARPEDTLGKDAAARLAKAREGATKLKLQSCMGGKVPLARIDGKFYRIGDLVNDTYIVRVIENRSAVVEFENERFELQMEMGKSLSPTKRR